MFFQTLSLWLPPLLYLIPVLIAGIIILRKTTSIDRFEILIPTGSIFGISIFTFLINIFSFITLGKLAVYLAYLFLILIGIFIYKVETKKSSLSFPSRKVLLFYLISILAWATFIFWKGNKALIGSDTNLYYSVAHTFIKGNFPPQTPWQPDLPLSYHLGALQLLGSFHSFTNLSFEFLHIFFSCLFIFLSSQIVIWIWKRHESVGSFIWGNLIAAVVFISFGFLKLSIPIFPIKLPGVSNLHQLFMWIRNLPTVNQTIEVYGAPINLDALIYFIFHAFGLALILCLLTIVFYSTNSKRLFSWIILFMGLVTLSIINESMFVIAAPALIFVNILNEIRDKTFLQNIKYIAFLTFFSVLMIIFHGGMINNTLFPPKNLEKTVLIFPEKADIKQDFTAYHHYQQISKTISQKEEWLPLSWFHFGADILIMIAIISLIFIKFSNQQKILLYALLIMSVFSLLAYNFIVPKYLVANGNRFLSFTFITLSLFILFALQSFFDNFSRKFWLKYLVITLLALFILMPTILPPLLLLTKTRFGENKLIPKTEQMTDAIRWIKSNLPFSSRIIVLDAATPHPSGQARVMVQAGVFAPIFPSEFRAYTIEASPEYLDIAYFLSPKALRELKIDTLLIDSNYYEKIDNLAKDYLKDQRFFEEIYKSENTNEAWEKVFKIKQEYYTLDESEGTISQLVNIPLSGKIYIDNEENFDPSYLRRALIFSLRGKNLYFMPQSGVYLNVEVDIPFDQPEADIKYDYLLLGKRTNPELICYCQAEIIWKGLNDEVYLWKNKGLVIRR